MAVEIRIGTRILQPNRQLLADGEHVHLGARALALLTHLAEAGGQVVTKDELFDAVWQSQVVEENALQAHISAIRKALGPESDRLKTLRGVGYQLDISPTASIGGAGAEPIEDQAETTPPTPQAVTKPHRSRSRIGVLAGLALLFVLALVGFSQDWFASGSQDAPAGAAEVTIFPLDSASDDPDEEALAAGITGELIVRLRRIPELRVRTGLAGEDPTGNALFGTVRRDGDQLRVSARLVDDDRAVRWSENFDREVRDLLSVQEDIAAAVADTLSVTLDVGVESQSYGGTNDPEAFLNFVRGRGVRFNPDTREGIAYLERAVELDPSFARAQAELMFAYGFRLFGPLSEAETAELIEKMDRASDAALEAAPDLAISHIARAFYFATINEQARASASAERATALDPGNDPDVKERLSILAGQFGRDERALSIMRERQTIDPALGLSNRPGGMIQTYAVFRQFGEAIEEYETSVQSGIEISPMDQSYAYWSYILSGDSEGASDVGSRLGSIGSFTVYEDYSPATYESEQIPNLGYEELRQWADRTYGPTGAFALMHNAVLAGYAGNHRLAVDYLRLGTERPNVSGNFWLWHPALSETRKTDGFEQLMFDIGLVDIWRESGDWGDYCQPLSATEIACE